MSQMIVYKVHPEHQKRMIDALCSHFTAIMEPLFLVFSNNFYALQVKHGGEPGQSDLVIITEPATFICFLSKIKTLFIESSTPLVVESYSTTLHYFDFNVSENHRIPTDFSQQQRHVFHVLDLLAKRENGISIEFEIIHIHVWKYGKTLAIRLNDRSCAIFADSTVLANDFFSSGGLCHKINSSPAY